MTAEELVEQFGLQDGGMINGSRALRATRNRTLAHKMIAEIRTQKAAILAILDEEASRHQTRLATAYAADAARSRWALVNSGSYLCDWELVPVIELTADEKAQYTAEWAAKRLYRTARGVKALDVKRIRQQSTISALTERAGDGHLAYGESVLWLLTDAEATQVRDALDIAVQQHENARNAARDAAEADRSAHIAEAAATGQPVVLNRWMAECDGSEEDCSMDALTEIAYPDGHIGISRKHAF